MDKNISKRNNTSKRDNGTEISKRAYSSRHLLLPLTNSDVFSTPAAASAATAWNTRTAAISNSLRRHSRQRKTDEKTAFILTCLSQRRLDRRGAYTGGSLVARHIIIIIIPNVVLNVTVGGEKKL